MRSFLAALACAALCAAPSRSESGAPPWVGADPSGRLVYRTLPGGDRIMDFSHAGYGGGGVKIPAVPVKKTLGPSGGDDTGAIQAALDAVAGLQEADGFRGAVLLKAGRYRCGGTLNINKSGVVLRGSGAAATVIEMAGRPHLFLSISGSRFRKVLEPAAKIVDAYVPSGAESFSVDAAAGFKEGDAVVITRPVTPEWVRFMGMDRLVRAGKRRRIQKWVTGDIYHERVIRSISGNRLTLDVPLSDSLDARFLGGRGAAVAKYLAPARISHVGVESLGIVSPAQGGGVGEPHHRALSMKGVSDAWARDLEIVDTVGSLAIGANVKRVTVDRVRVRHTVRTSGPAKAVDFSVDGSQILLNRCSVIGDDLIYFATGARVTGPNVLLNSAFHGNGWIEPHMRWATGLLVDGCAVPGGGIDFMNRGAMGSGHGWTVGWAVAWNSAAKRFIVEQPPGAVNWAIGCRGEGLPADSGGAPAAPASLYLAQLRERLGPQALKNIGY